MRFQRSPLDVLNTILALIGLLLFVALEFAVPTAIIGIEADLNRLFGRLPEFIALLLILAAQVTVIVANISILVYVVRGRRWRLFGTAVLGIVLTAVAFSILDTWLARPAPPTLDTGSIPGPLLDGETWPDTLWLGCFAAYLMVFSTVLSQRWRRALWWLFAGLVFMRIVTSASLPLDLGVSITLGLAFGSLSLLALGRPDIRPTLEDVEAALASLGVPDPTVAPASVDARGSTPYFATASDGSRVFAKVLTANERYADIMFRFYRRLRFRSLGDEKPFSTLRRAVEHEAMLALMARDIDVQTPRLVGVATVGQPDALLLSYEAVDGKSLDSIPPERMTDDVLRQAWTLVQRLHDKQIAHRDLRLANVFLDDQDRVWIIDFGFGEAACSPDQKSADIAELLASSATVVGSERAVAAAASAVPAEELVLATARLQPLALSTATRGAVKSMDGGLDGLRQEVSRVSGGDAAEPVPLERIKPRTLFTLVVIGAAVYFLLPQVADLPGLFRAMRDIDLAWLAPVILASLATYAGAALGLASSVALRVPYLPALNVSLAGSFVNRLAPVKVAGAALNIRFLQKRGVDLLTAVAGAGLIAMAGGIAHITVTALALLVAGKQQEGLPFKLPDTWIIVAAVVGLLIVIGLALWVPRTAKLIKEKVVPAFKSARDNLLALAKTPRKVVGLFAGGLLVPVSYSACLYFAVMAFGGGLSWAEVAVVFLTIGTLASAAPTPGGVGVVEAALIGGLTAAGLPGEQAVASVFLYRLATFWFPVLPGWGSFTWLQRKEVI
jgi:undecaprenyl-diphosphatase